MDRKQVNEQLNRALKCMLLPGFTAASYAIMIDGELVAGDYLGTTGGKENKPISANNTFNIGSCTKVYTAVAVMQLVEAGRLDLDTPVVEYLPEFKMLSDGYQRITLRHCLAHSSGMPGTQWKLFATPETVFEEDDYKRMALEYFSHSHLKAEPGEYSVYCNDGFTLAELCVSAVSDEKDFSQYCKNHITDPIGAYSSRFAQDFNPEYEMISMSGMPKEVLTPRGAGGISSTMEDLAKFGNEFLRPDSKMLSPESKREMAKKQGSALLKGDGSVSYALGWHSLGTGHPIYDIGDDVLTKDGGTMQFGSQLLVVPKYNAAVAFSHTFDGGVDMYEVSLLLLSLALLYVKGINITKYKVVPESYIKKYSGDYINSQCCYVPNFIGPFCFITREDSQGRKGMLTDMLGYTGTKFRDLKNTAVRFDSANRERYMLMSMFSEMMPIAQKAKDGNKLTAAWTKRLGKSYINVSIDPRDEAVYAFMTGFKLSRFKDYKGIMLASFPKGALAGGGVMDIPVKALDRDTATSFYAARDVASLLFHRENGAEYCDAVSYLYRDCDSLPIYKLQNFEAPEKETKAYKIAGLLEKLPDIPDGRRAIVLGDDLNIVYDSLMMMTPYNPVSSGYLLLC